MGSESDGKEYHCDTIWNIREMVYVPEPEFIPLKHFNEAFLKGAVKPLSAAELVRHVGETLRVNAGASVTLSRRHLLI